MYKHQYYFISLLIVIFSIRLHAQILDPVIQISTAPKCQEFAQVAYNCNADEYFVVWEDHRTADSTGCDIYGQIVRGDGTLRGDNVSVCTDTTEQWWPHVAFDPYTNRYLVVFSDNRNGDGTWLGNYDIYGALLDENGNHISTATSEPDTCFGIATDSSAVHYPAVAFNYLSRSYLVVWADYRTMTTSIFGQIIGQNGELLSPPDNPDPAVNFAICTDPTINHDVPDVSYSGEINEWFVVFSRGDWINSTINGQRIAASGALLKRDGTPGNEAIQVSELTGLDIDWVQPRVQFNDEYLCEQHQSVSQKTFSECLVTWLFRSFTDREAIDIFGARVVFFPDSEAVALGLKESPAEDGLFFAASMDEAGQVFLEPADGFAICNASGYQNAPDIAFSTQDNEFIIGWGDERRTKNWDDPDFYCQRLCISPDTSLAWLNADRNNTVASNENIAVDTSIYYEGGNLVGAAHNTKRNQFFLVYAFLDTSLHRGFDLHGRLVAGSLPSAVNNSTMKSKSQDYVLYQNYPNPFNPDTKIDFSIPKDDQVTIEIFDITGRKINTLLSMTIRSGSHSVVWDGKNFNGKNVASGIYFYRIRTNTFSSTKKMMLLR